MYHSPGDEVDVVVVELDASIANPFSPQLVQLGVIDPLHTLWMGEERSNIIISYN